MEHNDSRVVISFLFAPLRRCSFTRDSMLFDALSKPLRAHLVECLRIGLFFRATTRRAAITPGTPNRPVAAPCGVHALAAASLLAYFFRLAKSRCGMPAPRLLIGLSCCFPGCYSYYRSVFRPAATEGSDPAFIGWLWPPALSRLSRAGRPPASPPRLLLMAPCTLAPPVQLSAEFAPFCPQGWRVLRGLWSVAAGRNRTDICALSQRRFFSYSGMGGAAVRRPKTRKKEEEGK